MRGLCTAPAQAGDIGVPRRNNEGANRDGCGQELELAQIFGPRANGITRMVLAGTGIAVLVVAVVWLAVPRSSWITLVDRVRPQPVPFRHQHHVRGLGLDCR